MFAHAHLHLLGRVLGEQSLIDGELEHGLGRGEVDVPDRYVLHAAFEQRLLPGDEVGARDRRGGVVTEMPDQPVDDRRLPLDGGRRELGFLAVGFEEGAQRHRRLVAGVDRGRTGERIIRLRKDPSAKKRRPPGSWRPCPRPRRTCTGGARERGRRRR